MRDSSRVEPVVYREEVLTIMRVLSDIRLELERINRTLGGDNGGVGALADEKYISLTTGSILRFESGGRLVLRKTSQQNGPRQNADQPAVFDHRHAFEVLLLQRAKRFVEVHRLSLIHI